MDWMTAEEVYEEFKHWSFKMPGFEINMSLLVARHAAEMPYDFELQAMLNVHIHTVDSYDPDGGMRTFTAGTLVPPMTRDHFPSWLRRAVHEIVTHEADEWLERDGVKVFDPHRNEKR